MADFVNARFSPALSITTDQISFVGGVTALNHIVSVCITEEDDGLLLGMPIYGSFSPDLQTMSK
jgi:hypothetical protein